MKIDPNNLEDVQKFLKEELFYCDCASPQVLEDLYMTLTFARDIPNSPSRIRKAEIFPLGFGEWFIYFLESKNLIWHGFNNSDFAINELGRQLLRGLENFRAELALNESVLNNLADAYLQMELYDRALQTIETFVQKFPQKAVGYHTQAEIYFALAQYENALDSITKSIELSDSVGKQEFKATIERNMDVS